MLDNENNNGNGASNNVIFAIKTQNYMFVLWIYQQKTIKNYQNFLAKDLKDLCIRMNIRQKFKIKMQQIFIDIFLN